MENKTIEKKGLITKMEPLYFHSDYDQKTGNRVTVAGIYDGRVLRLGVSKYSAEYKIPFSRQEGRERALNNVKGKKLASAIAHPSLTLDDFIVYAKQISSYVLKHRCWYDTDTLIVV